MVVMHVQVCPDLARWTRNHHNMLDITPTAPAPPSSPNEEEGLGMVSSEDGVAEGEAAEPTTLFFRGVLYAYFCLL